MVNYFKYMKTIKVFKVFKSPYVILLSELKHLLAHLSKYLVPDSKLSNHRHTQTFRVSYAHMYKINMTPVPKGKSYIIILVFQITHI